MEDKMTKISESQKLRRKRKVCMRTESTGYMTHMCVCVYICMAYDISWHMVYDKRVLYISYNIKKINPT